MDEAHASRAARTHQSPWKVAVPTPSHRTTIWPVAKARTACSDESPCSKQQQCVTKACKLRALRRAPDHAGVRSVGGVEGVVIAVLNEASARIHRQGLLRAQG
ncbi:hypothetical protein MTO96_027018 [Rhipicephalus appendiculatus]